MLIRPATVADEASMRMMWDEFAVEANYDPYPANPFDRSFITERIALLAEEPPEPIGCVYAGTPGEAFGFVYGLYVRPSARGKGIARALMRAMAEELHAQQREYVLVNVDTPNAAARALYRELGFVEIAQTLRLPTDHLLT